MRIDRIKVTNFKAIRSFEIDDLPEGIIGLTGSNGLGKSTLLNAIAYSLYGPGALETTTSDVVTWGQKKCEVVIGFTVGDAEHYSIARTQTHKGESKAELWDLDSGNQIASGAKAVTEHVEWLLGIDQVGFMASVFSRQDDLLGLGSLQAARRVSTMLRLLGIDQIDKAIKYVNEHRKERNGELETLRRIVQDTPDFDAADIRKQIEAIDKERPVLEEKIAKAIVERDEALEIRDALFGSYEQWVSYQNHLSSLNGKLSSVEGAINEAAFEARNEPVEPVKPDPYMDVADYNRRAQEYTSRMTALRSAMAALVCPTCGRPLEDSNKDHFDKELADLALMLEDIERDAPTATASMQYDKDMRYYREVELPQYTKADKRLRGALDIKKALEKSIAELMDGQETEDPSDKYQAAVAKYTLLNTSVTMLQGSLDAQAREREILQTRSEWYDKMIDTQKTNAKKMKALEREVVAYATCSAELARFKTDMVSGVIPALSERASELVAHITEGKYTEVGLTAQYDIQYRNDLGEFKSFPNLSGGEKDAFALAMRLAIADLRASKIGVLVLDEVFESLDPDRQESTWLTLESMASRFNQVFLVTHVAGFKDRAPYAITL
jgi:DNA repair exonuclease SbcCD ATPase subunit